MEEKAKNTPKKKKKPFVSMEIAKVPLNPQQAVLSCCEQPGRVPAWMGTSQCAWPECPGTSIDVSS